MGSQPRRRDSRRGRGGRGRSRAGGGGAAAGGGPPEGEDEKRRKEAPRIYRRAARKISEALAKKDFSYVAEVSTSVTAARTPIPDVVSLLVAGAEAYRKGKDEEWRPELSELAISGIQFAQEKTGYELSPERQQLFSSILTANLRKIAKKQERK